MNDITPIPCEDVTHLAEAGTAMVPAAQGSDFTTTQFYDPKVKARAYELLLTTDMDITDIAIDLGVNAKVVATWSRQGKWLDRKKELEVELFRSAEDKYRKLIIEHRAPTIERHIRVSKKIEEAVEKVIDAEGDEPNSMVVKRMAEALASATGVSARAAAITDRPFMDASQIDNQGGKKGKQPLIFIGLHPISNPDQQARTYDVTAETVEVDVD